MATISCSNSHRADQLVDDRLGKREARRVGSSYASTEANSLMAGSRIAVVQLCDLGKGVGDGLVPLHVATAGAEFS